MRMQLLMDSDEFWPSLQKDIQASKDYIYVQTLSFEGDRVGRMVSDELLSAQARDVRILVDYYTKYIISDRFLYRPKNHFNPELRMEYEHTFRMFAELKQSGIQVKFTNPVGFLLTRFPARNHKKMVLIDDHISYIGGINFSDHNFEWHDLMIRIDDPDIATFLKKDFLSTWQGFHVYAEKDFGDIQLYLYDGYSNDRHYQTLFEAIESAQKSIFIESPYMSFPFYERLRTAQKNGVAVTLISPEKNNRKNVARYTLWEAKRSGIDLWLYQPGMTHAKAMLIDDRVLILGSTNFDYVSYKVEQEIAAIITEKDTINDFRKRLIDEDLLHSEKSDNEVSYRKGLIHYLGLKVLGKALVSLARL